MTAHSILIGLLLTFPWALVGIITLGTAMTVVYRWLERFQNPHQARMAARSVRSQSRDGGQEMPVRTEPAKAWRAPSKARATLRAA